MGVHAGAHRSAGTIGRDIESARLATAVRAARDGRPSCVLLVGEGGVGKTRLLTETAMAARAYGMAVLFGRAAVATSTPFGVIAEALRSWHRDHAAAPIGAPLDHGLRLVLPEWSAPDAGSSLSEPQLRLLALEGVVRLLRQTAASYGGALVVLDDLHTADPESIEAARYLAAANVEGVCVAAGLRPWEGMLADSLAHGLSREGVADIVEVEPLDIASVAELIAALTTADPPRAFVDEVMARTDGVPLLIEELVAAHLRAGSVGIAEGTMVWRGDAVAVPRTVRELVTARLDRLDPAHRAVICAGAVLGEFRADLVAAVAGVSAVDEAIHAAVRSSLLDVAGEITFRHAILRDAVLDSMGGQARTDFHRRAAAALAGLRSDDAQTLERRASHHEAVGDADDAARLLVQAAGLRRRSHALLGAEQLARAALARALDPVQRVAASDAVAEALVAQGRWLEAIDIDKETSTAYGETPLRRHRMATAAVEAGRPDLAADVIARALDDGDDALALLIADGRVAIVTGDADRALKRAETVLTSTAADLDEKLAAFDLQARTLDFLGRRDEAEAVWSSLASNAAATGRTQAQLRAVVALGKIELFAGRSPQRLHEAVELAQSAGAFVELAWAEENLAIGLTLEGRTEDALRIVEPAIERCRRLGLDQLAYLLGVRGMIEAHIGGDAEPWLRAADEALPTADLHLHTASGRGDIALRDGRYADAVHWFEMCRQIMGEMPGIVPMDAPCWLVWALVASGKDDEARKTMAEVRQMPDLERWHTRPLLLDAAESLLAGDPAAVDALVSAHGDHLTAVDIGLMRLVGADAVTGSFRINWLREALDIYERLAMTQTAQRARRLLRDAGAPVPRKRRSDPSVPEALAEHGVTAREAEVLRLVGNGLSNAEIADRLVVSVRTVETHVSSLLAKLQVERRAQLVALTT